MHKEFFLKNIKKKRNEEYGKETEKLHSESYCNAIVYIIHYFNYK